MKTSQKEYNELLYAINDPNNLTDENVYYRIPPTSLYIRLF